MESTYNRCSKTKSEKCVPTTMFNKVNGYWLFALDCKTITEKLTGTPLEIAVVNYIAGNIWPELSEPMRQTYKDTASNIRKHGLPTRAPGLLTEIKYKELCHACCVCAILPACDHHSSHVEPKTDYENASGSDHDYAAKNSDDTTSGGASAGGTVQETIYDDIIPDDASASGEQDPFLVNIIPDSDSDSDDYLFTDDSEEEVALKDELLEYYERLGHFNIGL